MEYGAKIENLAEIKMALQKFPTAMGKNLQDAITKSVFLVHATAKELSPKDTGEMSRTHAYQIRPLRGEVYPTTSYAPFVHEGHRTRGGGGFVTARPWLKWTLDAEKGAINDFFKQSVEDTLNETVRHV